MNELSGDDEHSAQAQLSRAIANMHAASKHSSYMKDVLERAESLRHDLTEIVVDLERVYDRLDVRPEEIERANARLAQLRRLQDKYGDDLNAVIEYGQKRDTNLIASIERKKNSLF